MGKAARRRAKLSWHPVWTPETKKWVSNQIRKNMWRFDRAEDFDDLMQEARLLWFTLEQKYPIVNEAAHFDALYRTSLIRKLHDRARYKQKSVIDQSVSSEDVAEKLQLQGTPNYGYFNLLLEEMPDELKLVLRALTTGRVRLKVDKPAKKLLKRENLNMRLRRRLPELSLIDPAGDLRRILKHNS